MDVPYTFRMFIWITIRLGSHGTSGDNDIDKEWSVYVTYLHLSFNAIIDNRKIQYSNIGLVILKFTLQVRNTKVRYAVYGMRTHAIGGSQ